MEVVMPSEGSCFSYPQIMPGAREWVWSDEIPERGETITVTVHGLRRLLRLANEVFPLAMHIIEPNDAWKVTEENLHKALRESSSMWCDGELVMSRLFVTDDGKVIAHPNEDVDAKSIFPWEKKQPEKE